jgi:hypothetical protein
MRNIQRRSRFPVVLTTSIAMALFCVYANAESELKGQWIGNSQMAGETTVAKTSLSLGAPDDDGTTLRVEGRSTCTLRQGHYAAGSGGDWSLSFKDAKGGESCTRLAQGTFVLHAGNTPRQLTLDVAYPGPDGHQNERHGMLTRYP